jgi:uncharacterized protein (TIGR02453 family)
MKKQYFTEAYLYFFMDLAANNHKDWFDQNRSRYQIEVKARMEVFVGDLIVSLKKDADLGDLKPSDCIFRINKDIRFSKDKTPYKLQMSALVVKGGRKQMHDPGLYIELGPEFLNIYTGFYMPEKDQLSKIREKIAADPKTFEKIISAKAFKDSFGEVRGEKSKIIPKELKESAKDQELIYNKQFYLVHQVDAEKILDNDLIGYVLNHYKSAAQFNRFLI